jgi:hypothetical protein
MSDQTESSIDNQNDHDENIYKNNINRYENSKIYMLWTFDECYYIGSTINDLRYRLRDHKQHSKKYPERKVYKHINEIGWENVEIKLLEEYPCTSLSELLQKENEYITWSLLDANCLNENAAHLTEEELLAKQATYRQEHRDKILAYKQQYRKENSDKIAEYNKKYIEQNKDSVAERKRAYNQANKEKIAAQTKAYSESHREQFREYNRVYKEKHSDEIKQRRIRDKEKISEKGRKYYAENKDAVLQRNREYQEANKDRLAERQKELRKLKGQPKPVECEICHGSYQEYRKSRHESSKKHQDALHK